MADFSRSLAAHGAAMCIVETARKAGLIGGAVNVDPRLAELEKQLFLQMLAAVVEHGKHSGGDLSPDEIGSMFTFAAAKGAEAASTLFDGKLPKFELTGLFDGRVPIAAGEEVIEYFKQLAFPSDCAENFLDWFEESAPPGSDPHLTLFEALKWCFRLSFHAAWEFVDPAPDADAEVMGAGGGGKKSF